ncbi:metallophosphoesterase family protein [Peptoniphilus sp.]|uniref:metallophosphoesterase family protein n=1 Tax=Peptoniphilus sp. TaxID=1971214 RepID=UPI00399618D6
MKLIHTADLHLKKSFNNINFDKKTRQEDLWITFESIVRASNDVDFLLLCGDLFEREFFSLSDFKRFFQTLESTRAKVLICFGNHDYVMDKEIFEIVDIPENVYIFGNTLDFFEFGDTRFYGFSWDRDSDPKINLKINLDNNFTNILMMHGSYEDMDKYFSFSKESIEGYDFVFLGHIHKSSEPAKNVYYPGSPEGLSFSETGKRTYNLVNIVDKNIFVEKIKSNRREIVNETIDVTDMELYGLIETISKFSNDDVVRIELVGKTDNPKYFFETLKDRFTNIVFSNQMKMRIDLEEIIDRNQDNFLGKYLERLNHDNPLERRAIEIGLELLGEEDEI